MLEQIREGISNLSQQFGDSRIHHCDIQATALVGNRCALSGKVLDADTRETVVGGLSTRFPDIAFETGSVRLLRTPSPCVLTVSTNVSGLHAAPSFGSEMVSQLLNGWQVEMLLEQDSWVYARQPDGYLGWTYRPYLGEDPAPTPTHIICEPASLTREAPDDDAAVTGRLLAGTSVAANVSEDGWAQLSLAGNRAGWAPGADFRPLDLLPEDEADRREQIVQDCFRFIGVPYLWGGITAFGLDCSGYVQMLHRLVGVTILRDADMQYESGQPVETPFQPGDLLLFRGKNGHRAITHVGMSLGGWRMIHASRSRNGVYVDDVQAVSGLRDSFAGARSFLASEALAKDGD